MFCGFFMQFKNENTHHRIFFFFLNKMRLLAGEEDAQMGFSKKP